MFRANFQRTGVYQKTGVRQLRGLKWKFRASPALALPSSNRSCAVGDEVVCVQDLGGNLYGLDAQTGQQIWVFQIGKRKKFFSPAISEGVVYVGTRQLNSPTRDEYIHAINVKSGQQKWSLKLPFQSFSSSLSFVWGSAPTIANGVVYIGGNDGNLYAIDASSGEILWSFKTTKNMPLTSPAVDGKILCVCSSDGYLYTIDLATRQQKWKFEIGGLSRFLSSCPAIANEKVYIVSSENILYALNLQTGQSMWSFNVGSLPFYLPAITERIVCIGGGEGFLYTLDAETGRQLWRFKTGDMQYWSSPIIAQETVYLSSLWFLQALNIETGEQLWQFQAPFLDRWGAEPQMWFYGLANQVMKAIVKNTFNLEGFYEPVISDGVVYVSCSNGYLYALH